MKLIGLAGTNGSGKDSVGEILANKYNYLFISVSDLLRDEASKRGEPIEREVLRSISAEWRREYGLGVLVDKAVEQFDEQGGFDEFAGLVIASLRNPGESDRVHELGGKVVWTDADPKIRYDRIYSRQRTEEDAKTFKQFVDEEKAEMEHDGDAATLSMREVKRSLDFLIVNDGSTLEELELEVANKLESVL